MNPEWDSEVILRLFFSSLCLVVNYLKLFSGTVTFLKGYYNITPYIPKKKSFLSEILLYTWVLKTSYKKLGMRDSISPAGHAYGMITLMEH